MCWKQISRQKGTILHYLALFLTNCVVNKFPWRWAPVFPPHHHHHFHLPSSCTQPLPVAVIFLNLSDNTGSCGSVTIIKLHNTIQQYFRFWLFCGSKHLVTQNVNVSDLYFLRIMFFRLIERWENYHLSSFIWSFTILSSNKLLSMWLNRSVSVPDTHLTEASGKWNE